MIDAKSRWTHEHCDRVYAIAIGIASAHLGFDVGTALRDLGRAARLHDIGNLSISNRILDRPGPLTDTEWRTMMKHPLLTEHVLERVPILGALAPLAGAHHERVDGTGYPRGSAGGELTMPMRVLAVADVYAALTVERPYRPAYTPDRALELMRDETPRRLDGDAVAALSTHVSNRGASE